MVGKQHAALHHLLDSSKEALELLRIIKIRRAPTGALIGLHQAGAAHTIRAVAQIELQQVGRILCISLLNARSFAPL